MNSVVADLEKWDIANGLFNDVVVYAAFRTDVVA